MPSNGLDVVAILPLKVVQLQKKYKNKTQTVRTELDVSLNGMGY